MVRKRLHLRDDRLTLDKVADFRLILHFVNNSLKAVGLGVGKARQDFAIEFDVGVVVHCVDEARVRDAMLPHACVDAVDPSPSDCALLDASVPVRVLLRLVHFAQRDAKDIVGAISEPAGQLHNFSSAPIRHLLKSAKMKE